MEDKITNLLCCVIVFLGGIKVGIHIANTTINKIKKIREVENGTKIVKMPLLWK